MYYIKATRCSQIAATANQAPDYLFHVLLLMSLVAAGEAGEVHSAPTPQPRRGKACSALTNSAKTMELRGDRSQTHPPSTGNWLSPAQMEENCMGDFNPKFPLFPSRLGKTRNVWIVNKRFLRHSFTGSRFSVHIDWCKQSNCGILFTKGICLSSPDVVSTAWKIDPGNVLSAGPVTVPYCPFGSTSLEDWLFNRSPNGTKIFPLNLKPWLEISFHHI